MTRRIRSSKTALENALEVLAKRGLPVHKVLITGGQYEVYTRRVERWKLALGAMEYGYWVTAALMKTQAAERSE